MLEKFKKLFINISPIRFALIIGVLNLVLYHLPFFRFVIGHVNFNKISGFLITGSLIILIPLLNALVVYIFCLIFKPLAKIIWSLFFIVNAITIFFVNTYNIMMGEEMVGNVLNTNTAEASSYLCVGLVIYTILLGVIPVIYIIRVKLSPIKFKPALRYLGLLLLPIIILLSINIGNIPWVHLYSEHLGSYLMPWSYTVNIGRYYKHRKQNNQQEELLPDAQIKDEEKTALVLVIGESARRENFSLYGYKRNTNPLLSQTENLHHFNANSVATYTIAGVKAILEHEPVKNLHECLPSYLKRSGVYVVWRTTNTGEPQLSVDKYQNADSLKKLPPRFKQEYDEILLNGLKEEISGCGKNKVLAVLHTGTSHGPAYSTMYPPEFEVFKPVCTKVELEKCPEAELYNAYDNTIVYTDYILHSLIEELKSIKDYRIAMIYISDHGESLGENSLYMHGMDRKFAPKQQYEIPFIVWLGDEKRQLKENDLLTQHHIFHSVLNFLAIESPVYKEEMNIFK